jgi:hypothetical protein
MFRGVKCRAMAVLTITVIVSLALPNRSCALAQDSAPKNSQAPSASAAPPKQPLPFSHKTHAEIGLPCQFCHVPNTLDHPSALPSAPLCMTCHAKIDKDKPAIRALASFAQENRPIPWARVYSVPGWVYWSHAAHLKANLKCAECHGDVGEMEVVRQAVNVTTMKGCTTCHQQHHVVTDCHSCHEVESN